MNRVAILFTAALTLFLFFGLYLQAPHEGAPMAEGIKFAMQGSAASKALSDGGIIKVML